ncbi:hypothetical protein SAMN04488573_1011270 [Bacillus sp. 5mfcol3.1]|uniref:hypothetical protein n=1 Tax=Bacillus sp. 5mfcol3.1 TaxID=1761756 RepID=UPI0008EE2C65|nr:hypothetical protein [Bacillus sp. 5mfcol3.1]SFK73875.1 hypothetical protein SAMN04488573_1011270 [Bacillus sp. 5mfcol3.1]
MEKIKSVAAIIFNNHNEILCASYPPIVPLPNHWKFPCFEVSEGNLPHNIVELKKNISEDIGCSVEIGEKIGETNYKDGNNIIYLTIYEAKIESGSLKKNKYKQLKWVKLSNLERKEIRPIDKKIIRILKKKLEDNQWSNLTKKLYTVKKICLVTILLISIAIISICLFGFKNIPPEDFIKKVIYIITGYIVSVIWSYYFHFKIFKKITETNKGEKTNLDIKIWGDYLVNYRIENDISIIKLIYLLILSHDLFFANVFKFSIEENHHFNKECPMRKPKSYSGRSKHLHNYNNREIDCFNKRESGKYGCEMHQEKKKKTYFVIYSNWVNVIMAIILFFIVTTITYLAESIAILDWLFILVLIRLISRAIEIGLAFYNDVVKTKMNSDLSIGRRSTNLKRGNRISLAVHSYLELVLIFGMLYQLKPEWISKILIVESHSPLYFIHGILYSASVSAFNISFDIEKLTLLGEFIHALQVFLSIILVVLSIATYLGLKDEMNEYEKADWENGER